MTEHIKIGDISPKIQYEASGSDSVFTYPFPIFRDEDLKVYVNESLVTSGYTVSGAGNSNGGEISFSSAPANGSIVTIFRSIEIARQSDFQAGGAFRASVINDELDFQTAALQELAENIKQAIRRPVTDSEKNMTVPDALSRAGKVLAFDEDGNVIAGAEITDIESAVAATKAGTQTGGMAEYAFTGNGTAKSFDTGIALGDKAYVLVIVNGVLLPASVTVYDISGTSVVFVNAPCSGDDIRIRVLDISEAVTAAANASASALSASVSETNATSSETNAANSASAAAASAASIDLPETVTANSYLKAKSDALGYEAKTSVQVAADIAANFADEAIDYSKIDITDKPAFLAFNSATDENVTGDGSSVAIVCDSEVFDKNSDYDTSTGYFTAPEAGKYRFTGAVVLAGLDSAHTNGQVWIDASNRDVYGNLMNVGAVKNVGGNCALLADCLVDMDENDTACLKVKVDNGTKVVDVYGHATLVMTFFSGEKTA